MNTLNIQRCPETGICSIIKDNDSKIDLMPEEAATLAAATNAAAARTLLSEVDAAFTANLTAEEIEAVMQELK